MNNEYVIINKTAIQKRIDELENIASAYTAVKELKQILSQSTPLIPVVGNAWDASLAFNHPAGFDSGITKQDYISNLKLDI